MIDTNDELNEDTAHAFARRKSCATQRAFGLFPFQLLETIITKAEMAAWPKHHRFLLDRTNHAGQQIGNQCCRWKYGRSLRA